MQYTFIVSELCPEMQPGYNCRFQPHLIQILLVGVLERQFTVWHLLSVSLCTWTGHVTIVVLFCVVWALCTEDFVFMAFDFCQKPQDSWVKHLCYRFLCSDVCSCNDQWGCSQLPSAITIFVKLLSACVLSLLTCPFFLNTSQENAWARIFVSETMCMNLN